MSAHERADGEDRYIFIGNYTSEEKTVDLGTAVPATDLETREPVTERKLTLPPFGCRILKKKD
ncbi:MAG: Beta-galactosidase C-terminal domain [Clostridia bacterium]|nr:Beta-galactosidase C-terminal domain [Clostridia bacterium]